MKGIWLHEHASVLPGAYERRYAALISSWFCVYTHNNSYDTTFEVVQKREKTE